MRIAVIALVGSILAVAHPVTAETCQLVENGLLNQTCLDQTLAEARKVVGAQAFVEGFNAGCKDAASLTKTSFVAALKGKDNLYRCVLNLTHNLDSDIGAVATALSTGARAQYIGVVGVVNTQQLTFPKDFEKKFDYNQLPMNDLIQQAPKIAN